MRSQTVVASAASSLMAASAAGHVLMLSTHGHGPVLVVGPVGMTPACAWSAVHGFLRPSDHGLSLLMGMSLAIVWSAGLVIRCGRPAHQTGLDSTGDRVVRERMPT